MDEIAVVGGGFAGVWAAAGAAALRERLGGAARDLSITLFSPQSDMVIRPRLYEADPGQAAVALSRILDPVDVEHVPMAVTELDVDRRSLVVAAENGRTERHRFDRLVLATGSRLVRPQIPGHEYLHDVDTLPGALALDAHLHDLASQPAAPGRFTAVVTGAGFTGIELSTELVGRLRAIAAAVEAVDEVRVVLVEREPVVGPELGAGPRPVIERALRDLGVEVRVGTTVAAVDPLEVMLADGTVVPARTAAWTVGMRAQGLTEQVPAPRDGAGRLGVDRYLRVSGIPGLLAAGDTAAAQVEGGHFAMQSCQHAHAMGRVAGHNAVADLYGLDLAPFTPDPYVTCLDLGAAGAVFTTGFERKVMLTGSEAKQLKRKINRAIYPPVDDREEILRLAELTSASRVQTPADV
jgi:NADH dehydrogenase